MLLEQLRDDLKAAMKAKDKVRLRAIRSILGAVQEAEVAGDQAVTLDDAAVEKVIASQAKRRVESAEAFAEGGRPEQAAEERAELAVLEEYLPEALSAEELTALVDAELAAGGFTEKAQMGNAMKAVNAKVAGRADGRMVADLVKERLA